MCSLRARNVVNDAVHVRQWYGSTEGTSFESSELVGAISSTKSPPLSALASSSAQDRPCFSSAFLVANDYNQIIQFAIHPSIFRKK